MALDSVHRTLTVVFNAAVLLITALLPLNSQGQDQSQRYWLTQPDDFSEEQWSAHLKELNAAGRLSDGSLIPWDFKTAGSVWFADGEIGLTAPQRLALARQMDAILNMRSPYREAYCTLTLHITGPRIQDSATRRLVWQRVAAVRHWFIARGYDATLVEAGAWYGNNVQEVQWQLTGGLLPKVSCEVERTRMRKKLAANAKGNRNMVQ